MMEHRTVRITLLALLWIHQCTGHPQCLDFRPPFQLKQPLEFCAEYSSFGCCTTAQDQALADRHRETLVQTTANTATSCGELLRQFLCLECSPYAAHLFDSEDDGIQAPLPGLCGPFCGQFYDACEGIIPSLNTVPQPPSMQYLNKEGFCKMTEIADMDYCYPELLTNPVITGELNRTASTVEGCLCLEEFASDLRSPLIFRHFPDDSGRILVAEQVGVVHVFTKNGTNLATFMDISHLVLTSSRRGDERGLLGIAFHPNYTQNKKFYCYFSVRNDGAQKIQVSEFLVSSDNPNEVNVSYSKVILEVKQPYANHNGGEILFGEDGYLYLFLGDGGSAGDPGNRAQDRSTLLGKVLRLDVNVPSDSEHPYNIPPDNPYFRDGTRDASLGRLQEIFAYGIRNIWRCDLDEGDPVTGYGKGRIICGDVGQNAFEEIDIITKGGNYGWRIKEGFSCYRASTCGPIDNEVLPIHAYPHSVGKSVTGGHVYRGCLNPALNGAYIYGDFVTGKLFKLEETSPGGAWENRQLQMCGTDVCFNGLVNRYETSILSFGEDDDGEVYILTTSDPITSQPNGKVYKIIDPRRRGDPATCRSWKEPPTTTTTTTTPPDTTTAIQMTSGGGVPRPDLRPAYLVLTTCLLLPFINYLCYWGRY